MSSKKKLSGNMKQGNLFSFFSKKPKTTTTTTPTPTPAPSKKPTANLQSASKSAVAAATKSPSTSTTDRAISPKPISVSQSSSAPPTPPSASAPAPRPTSQTTNTKWKQVSVGDSIAVYWPDDKEYYQAVVTKQRGGSSSSNFHLEYEDGESEWIDLSTEKFRYLASASNKNKNKQKNKSDMDAPDPSAPSTVHKRRRQIDESDEEEEHEWQDDAVSSEDEDGSVYEAKGNDDDDDEPEDESQWMVTDDEDDAKMAARPAKKKAKKATALKVTHHNTTRTPADTYSSPSATTTSSTSTSMSTGSAYETPLRQFANTVSPRTASSHKSTKSSQPTTPPNPRPEITPAAKYSNSNSNKAGTKVLPYTKGSVNPMGSHVHNHLKFLQDPKDASGKRPGEPGYDPRTLKVCNKDWDDHCGKMTNAVQQWWDLKSRYFDTVLLFKTGTCHIIITCRIVLPIINYERPHSLLIYYPSISLIVLGKFYEMFHMDADIGVEIMGHIHMKGHVAHSGFPEISYGPMADKLVRAGYKVARVEQTETPDQLKERKQKTRTGKKPQVVNREVCSILTLGTRTFCALDDVNALVDIDNKGGSGPLLVIREVLVDSMETEEGRDDDQVQPVCEYGITLVDAVRATVTVGQFADDILRSRMNTLLTAYSPAEILIQGGQEGGASPTLQSLIKAYQTNSRTTSRLEYIQDTESYPKSTALDPNHRRQIERTKSQIQPWSVQETMDELHRRGYYPRASKTDKQSIRRWPQVMQAVVEGKADLCLSSFGAALFYLQRNLIDQEILSMGIVKAYIPPASSCISQNDNSVDAVLQQSQSEEGMEATPLSEIPQITNAEDQIKFMSLDGTTLHNLEILTNAVDQKVAGSLWSKINFTKTPHGARLLRAWLLRPLFRKAEIERRADAVQELVAGAGAVALNEARQHVLGKIGDLDRLLSRIHSMSGNTANEGDDNDNFHPGERAVLYENLTYTKRKVGDFSKVLNGLRKSCQIPELFADLQLQEDGLLHKIVKLQGNGGCFPSMSNELDWYFDNFDCDKAAKGIFEPSRGIDQAYDEACDTVDRIQAELEDYKQEICNELTPRHTAKSSWKYINTKPNSKDKYLIELPASVRVTDDFIVKGKRGSGPKQVNKYRTRVVAELIQDLEQALEIQTVRKAKGMQLIFAKFDSQRSLWGAAAQATAMLDALGSLAKTAGKPGFCRPTILDCPPNQEPTINIVQGRHACVETTIHSTEFIPNDLSLGGSSEEDSSRLLLLSGPNMGGKSTLLRQTCLIAILAQLGSYVPAESCELTPIDCIYTRLGASDRILLGQSTFFVELAEMAAALRGATRRSLVIMGKSSARGTVPSYNEDFFAHIMFVSFQTSLVVVLLLLMERRLRVLPSNT
jgi:DNA mismatch repair protein MSH6